MRPRPHTLFQGFQITIQPMTWRFQFELGWTESLSHFALNWQPSGEALENCLALNKWWRDESTVSCNNVADLHALAPLQCIIAAAGGCHVSDLYHVMQQSFESFHKWCTSFWVVRYHISISLSNGSAVDSRSKDTVNTTLAELLLFLFCTT